MGSKSKVWILAGLLFVLLTALPTICRAQFNSSVEGTVSDQTGAVVPGATVAITSVDTGAHYEAKSNGAGFYRFSSLAPGNYKEEAAISGFDRVELTISVESDETRGVDLHLTAAKTSESVTVHSTAQDLNPEETRLETTLTSQTITNLPIEGKDVQQLLALTPGVTGVQDINPAAGYGSTLFAAGFTPPYNANGLGTNSNLFLLDDLPVQAVTGQGEALIFPNIDMIDEVALQTQTYSVENGSSASLQVAFTTKSGTNRFHGDLDESYDSQGFGSAQSVLNTVTNGQGTPQHAAAPFHQSELLGSVGGPVWKNHTFLFFSLQHQNAGIGEPGTAGGGAVIDPAFATWAHQAFPNSPFAEALALAPPTRDVPGAGAKQVLASSISTGCGSTPLKTPNGVSYVLPCSTPVLDTGYLFLQSQPFDGTQWFLRGDQVFGNGDRIYIGAERITQTLGVLSDRPQFDGKTPSTTQYYAGNWIHVFNPNLINEARFSHLSGTGGTVLSHPAIGGSVPGIGPWSMIEADNFVNFTFFEPFGLLPAGPSSDTQYTYSFRAALELTKGKHVLRGGYQWWLQEYLEDQQRYGRTAPFFAFDTQGFPGLLDNEVSFGGGNYYNYSISATSSKYQPQVYGASVNYNAVWAQDSWKVRSNLTLTYGIRWDSFGNPGVYGGASPYGQIVLPASGGDLKTQIANTLTQETQQAFSKGQNVNFQPRVGVAYSPASLHNTTLRGGVGLYENTLTPNQIADNLAANPPVRINIAYNQPLIFGDFTTTSAPWGRVFNFPVYGINPSGAPYSNAAKTAVYQIQLNSFPQDPKPERYLLYNGGAEHQFPSHLVAGVSYSGSYGTGILIGPQAAGGTNAQNADYNLYPGNTSGASTNGQSAYLNQNFAQIRLTRDDGITSNYNALIATVRQHLGSLQYLASYTFGEALQDSPTTYNSSVGGDVAFWPSAYFPHTYRGPSNFDVRHSFNFGGVYEVPSVYRDNPILNQVASGWNIGAVVLLQTGTPFSVTNGNSGNYALDNSSVDGSQGKTPAFPDVAPGQKRGGFSVKQFTLNGALNSNNFSDPPGTGAQFVLSDQGANTFRNPGYTTFNISLGKAFPLHFLGDQGSFRIRGDFINAFNHTNWQGIDSSEEDGGSGFGFVKTANNKRFVQVGGRFQF